MPTTRRQEAIKLGKVKDESPKANPTRKRGGSKAEIRTPAQTQKRKRDEAEETKSRSTRASAPASKRARKAQDDIDHKPTATASRPGVGHRRASSVPPRGKASEGHDSGDRRKTEYQSGTIERGHIYFFYRPKVEVEEAHSIDEVKNLHLLLIPRPPEFAVSSDSDNQPKGDPTKTEEAEMKLLAPGADAVPAPVTRNTSKQYYRLITIGKKKLPDPNHGGKGKGRRDTFWGTVTSTGDDLRSLVDGLGPKTYETKTRGTRHESAARLVARGGYALVNTGARTPSQRETHLGYNVSHPSPSDMGDVQTTFGIYTSSSFVVQVKNPRAPNTAPGMGHTKEPEYPESIMKDVFGAGNAKGGRGRESFGLRFASVETPALLDYEGAQLLLIAAREGDQGLETSLGEGRGEALERAEDQEAHRGVMEIFKEIGLDSDTFTTATLEGQWA